MAATGQDPGELQRIELEPQAGARDVDAMHQASRVKMVWTRKP